MRIKYIIMSEVTFKLKDSDFLNDYLQRPSVQVHRPVFTRKKFRDIEERTLGIGIFMSWSWHCPGNMASILCPLFLNMLNEAIGLHLHFSRCSKNCLCNSSVTGQFSSVAQSCLTLCHPMNCNTPGLPVHHQLPEFTRTRVHWVGDAIQPSHPLPSPSPTTFSLSQHQGLSQGVSSPHQVAKVLEFQR